mmetsp:Transcript_50021/g.131593  ORF Transcript_50021/g.131593 Transcript_50021/m.131593 type:complete len:344 (+) Transcript_50021:98-1129(+)
MEARYGASHTCRQLLLTRSHGSTIDPNSLRVTRATTIRSSTALSPPHPRQLRTGCSDARQSATALATRHHRRHNCSAAEEATERALLLLWRRRLRLRWLLHAHHLANRRLCAQLEDGTCLPAEILLVRILDGRLARFRPNLEDWARHLAHRPHRLPHDALVCVGCDRRHSTQHDCELRPLSDAHLQPQPCEGGEPAHKRDRIAHVLSDLRVLGNLERVEGRPLGRLRHALAQLRELLTLLVEQHRVRLARRHPKLTLRAQLVDRVLDGGRRRTRSCTRLQPLALRHPIRALSPQLLERVAAARPGRAARQNHTPLHPIHERRHPLLAACDDLHPLLVQRWLTR